MAEAVCCVIFSTEEQYMYRQSTSFVGNLGANMISITVLLTFLTVISVATDNNCLVSAFSINNKSSKSNAPITATTTSRAEFFSDVLTKSSAVVGLASALSQRPAIAADEIKPKLTGFSDDELKRIITKDVVDNQFLVSADITREVYDESANFIDEIDTYPMQKWIVGTKRLFVAEKSRVSLVGDVNVSKDKVEFRFDEDLMFRIPLRPVVSLTGRVVLDRDPETGLITKYQEFWDQSVGEVLKTATFN